MISLFQTAPKQCANVLSGVAESGGSVASLGKNMCAPRTSLRQELQCDSVALTTVTWQIPPLRPRLGTSAVLRLRACVQVIVKTLQLSIFESQISRAYHTVEGCEI